MKVDVRRDNRFGCNGLSIDGRQSRTLRRREIAIELHF